MLIYDKMDRENSATEPSLEPKGLKPAGCFRSRYPLGSGKMNWKNKRPTPSHPVPEHLRIFSIFQLLFNTYLGRVCLFVSASNRKSWTVLFPPKQNLQPYHFEEYYGKAAKRDTYLRQHFDRMSREKRPLIGRFGDYMDFFAPYLSNGRCDGFLVSGPALDQCPTPQSLRLHWKNLTGVEGSDLNPDFLHYVRLALNTPVLDQEGLEGYSRLMELLAKWLSGLELPGTIPELDRLRVDIFARKLPHPYWVDWAIGIDKFFAKPEKGYILHKWSREEMGITRMPTVVAALMPQKPEIHSGTLDILCLARRFQHESYLAAHEVPETTSRPLGDYGAIVLTSAKPGLSAVQARLEVQEKIHSLCKILDRRLRTKVLAGIGSIIPGGENLTKSYREAVTSLYAAVQTGKTMAFTETMPLQRDDMSTALMRNLIKNLSESLARSSPARLALAREHFINQLLYTGYGPEISRAYMLSVLHMLLEQFERRSNLDASTADVLGNEWFNRLDAAQTLPDLVAAFRGILDALVRYQDKPKEASVAARLEKVIADISRNPGYTWHLKTLSKRSGLSAPTFLKWFQKIGGLPFEPFLRRARLSKAKELLREGHMNLERIAQECGFGSASSFIHIFRRAEGTSQGDTG